MTEGKSVKYKYSIRESICRTGLACTDAQTKSAHPCWINSPLQTRPFSRLPFGRKNIIRDVKQKIFIIYTLDSIGFLIFLKRRFCALYVKKWLINIFLLKVSTNYIPISTYFVLLVTSYLILNRLCLNIRTSRNSGRR